MPPPAAPAPNTSGSSGSSGSSEISDSYRRYALGILLVVYVFNFVDRQILAVLLPSIKADMQLTDTQLGLLSGIAFALFYSTLGVPIARWADVSVRRSIIALALVVWSLMTAASGVARGFTELLLARIGVGIGEAGCSPPAHSMISDLFPADRRATALSIYAMGIPIGIFFGYLAGGWINEFFGWRTAFLVVGLPGVLLAVVVRLTLREPPRGGAEGLRDAGEMPSVGDTARLLWSKRSFRHLSLAAALHAFVGYGVGNWIPMFLVRSHGMSSGEIGTWLALISAFGGGLGTFLGGYLSDRWGASDRRGYVWVPAYSTILAVPFSWFFYLYSDPVVALVVATLPTLLGSMYLGPTFALTQGLVPLRMRAVGASILLLIINLIGLGLGPWFVGVLSDVLTPRFGADGLRYALAATVVANLWSATHYMFAARTLREDLD